jgi:peptidoglycan hydrolase CwlO-like protein
MSAQEERALIAGQLADLTRAVEQMAAQVRTISANADTAQERANTQQERIDIAARELAEVSSRLQAAANALRESI